MNTCGSGVPDRGGWKRPGRRSVVWSVLVLVLVGVTVGGCMGGRLGGMTVSEAFPDERVAGLVYAAGRGDLETARERVDSGADVDFVGTDEVTPLMWMVGRRNSRGVEVMLELGADPNLQIDRGGGFSAIIMAARGPDTDILELLLEHGGDPNMRGRLDATALHFAVQQRQRKNIELLVDHGADVNKYYGLGITPAYAAVSMRQYELAYWFLDHGLEAHLDALLEWSVEKSPRDIPEQKKWREKLIARLRDKGVEMPEELGHRTIDEGA